MISQINFWNKTLHVSDSRIRMELVWFAEPNQFHPDPARKLSANLYDIYHCCVYSEKPLIMEKGTVRNMKSFIPKINLRN